MGIFEMVVAVVLIAAIASVVRSALKARNGAGPAQNQDSRLSTLEQRVRALEEVVGDSSYELKQKLRELEK